MDKMLSLEPEYWSTFIKIFLDASKISLLELIVGCSKWNKMKTGMGKKNNQSHKMFSEVLHLR